MEIKIDLKTDSDNSYCDNQSLEIVARPRLVILKLQSPYREIAVEREDLRKALSVI